MMLKAISLKQILNYLILETKGGSTRALIIRNIKDKPQNPNQLAKRIGRDYRTVTHHLKVLQKRSLITSNGDEYGTSYLLSYKLENNYHLFEETETKLKNKLPASNKA